jgi:hypothetical protein
MMDEPIDPELDRLFDLLAEEARGEPDPHEHLGAAILSAYHDRMLPTEQVSRVQEHLVACGQCRSQLLDHVRFMDAASEEMTDGVSSFEEAAAWRQLEERMKEPPLSPVLPKDYGQRSRIGRLWSSPHAARSLAAVLAVALVGVSFYADSLRRELRRPVAEEESKALVARSSQRSGLPRPEILRLPTTLALEVSWPTAFPEYQVDFQGEGGKVVKSLKVFRSSEEDQTIRIFLPREALKGGPYQVTLWGLKGTAREELGIYDLRIMT